MNYENYEIAQGWEASNFASFTQEQSNYYTVELQQLGLISQQQLRVLDIGFGNGSFLGWCRSRGWQCDGIEVNSRLVARANAHGYTATESIGDLPCEHSQKNYDLITAFDVLEHIDRDSLVSFFKKLANISTDHTLFLFRFPNGDNPFSLPLQNGDITHKTAIGQMMLRQIAQLAGFEVISLRSPIQALQGISLKRRISILIGLPFRWAIGSAIKHLFMGGLSVSFSSNLVAVLKKSAANDTSQCQT